jgi:hypothetical protein
MLYRQRPLFPNLPSAEEHLKQFVISGFRYAIDEI